MDQPSRPCPPFRDKKQADASGEVVDIGLDPILLYTFTPRYVKSGYL